MTPSPILISCSFRAGWHPRKLIRRPHCSVRLDAAPCVLLTDRDQGCLPKLFCRLDRCDLKVCPPRDFVAIAMQVAMMITAQWHREFVADLASQCSGLRKLQMMRIARRALADQARLCRDECEMDLVSPPHRFAQRRDCFGRVLAVDRQLSNHRRPRFRFQTGRSRFRLGT